MYLHLLWFHLTTLVFHTASLITITTAMAAWIAAGVTTNWKASDFVLIASNGVTLSAFLRLLLLTQCSVISLKCNNNAVVAYTTLSTVYLQVYI